MKLGISSLFNERILIRLFSSNKWQNLNSICDNILFCRLREKNCENFFFFNFFMFWEVIWKFQKLSDEQWTYACIHTYTHTVWTVLNQVLDNHFTTIFRLRCALDKAQPRTSNRKKRVTKSKERNIWCLSTTNKTVPIVINQLKCLAFLVIFCLTEQNRWENRSFQEIYCFLHIKRKWKILQNHH